MSLYVALEDGENPHIRKGGPTPSEALSEVNGRSCRKHSNMMKLLLLLPVSAALALAEEGSMNWKSVKIQIHNFVFVGVSAPGCPSSHRYAYLNGDYCCAHPTEANRPHVGDVPPCDGGPLKLDSRCCKDDAYIPCPDGKCISKEESRELTYGCFLACVFLPSHGQIHGQ